MNNHKPTPKVVRAAIAGFAVFLLSLSARAENSRASYTGSSNVLTFLFPGLSNTPPRYIFTAMTEFTDSGKMAAKAIPGRPTYYIAHSMGYQSKGDPVRESTATQEDIEPVLVDALAKNGFVRAGGQQQPDVAIIYMWGAHNPFDRIPDSLSYRNSMDRAALVGGSNWARRLDRAVGDSVDTYLASPKADLGNSPGAGIQYGMQAFAVMSPVRLFTYDFDNEKLLNQASDRCYFVVASAYDYQLLAKNERRLLWRTRLTVAANGVSQLDALPNLVSYSAPYFGREMEKATITRMPAVPIGRVKVGEPHVVR